ncbi:hypothetical protein BASA81_003511 [Batrachochytrium salamandrivorans]|nr:hypothetical protein BASA81_003511 [Batrachochytrium salamandrivorans]
MLATARIRSNLNGFVQRAKTPKRLLEALAVDDAGLVVLLEVRWKVESKARMEPPIQTEYSSGHDLDLHGAVPSAAISLLRWKVSPANKGHLQWRNRWKGREAPKSIVEDVVTGPFRTWSTALGDFIELPWRRCKQCWPHTASRQPSFL